MAKNAVCIHNFLQLISDHLPDMLWAKDLEGRYLFANKAICDNLLMTTQDDVIGKDDVYFAKREREKHKENPKWHTFGELCHNSDEVVLENMHAMEFEEYGNIRGELTYLNVHKAPLFDENGVLIGTIGSGRNITLQKKLQYELKMMNDLVNRGPIVLFEWGVEAGWPIKNVSQNVTAILGLSYEELMHTSFKFSECIHPEDLSKVTQEVLSYLGAKKNFFTQEYRILSNSREIWVKDFRVVDYDDEGNATSIKGYLLDNTAEVQAQKEIARVRYTDFLTGLANRQKMQEDMHAKKTYGCIVFNIDRFREINDLFGVSTGDSILVQVARWFQEQFVDVYRIGGDEFAMLLHEEMQWDLLEVKITAWLEQLSKTTFQIGSEEISVRMNVGVALGEEKLLTRADIALHNAKDAKIPYACYEVSKKIEEIYRTNIAMTATIHKALAEDKIVCYYQPIVDFATTKIFKYETLVRLRDTTGAVIAPIDFLPIAKKTKLYAQITKCVITQACEFFSGRKEEFSVNLSIDDIEDEETVAYIVYTIVRTGTASRIVFEILESEGIENYNSAEKFIRLVKAHGAKIAIDDFGTGYSNFEHVLKLHIDYIKIDGSLIRGIVENHRHTIIVETIVEFAKKIGARTIAEFVSDESIFEKVKTLGVDFSQGYYTGKPQPM